MAINPTTGSTVHRPQTTRTAANRASQQPTGPSDAVQLNSDSSSPSASGSQAPFETTPGGRAAAVALDPDSTRWYERSRDQLDQARRGEHPDQQRRAEQAQREETRRMATHERTFAQQETAAAEARETAEATYAQAEQRVQGGFQEEHQRLDRATERQATAEQRFDDRVGADTRSKLEQYQELSTRLENGEFSESMASNYRTFLGQLSNELRAEGIRTDRLGETDENPTRAQRAANELVSAQQELDQAGDFPRTPEAQQAWLEERAGERDAAIGRAEGQLELARVQLENQRQTVRSEISTETQERNERLLTTLEGRLERDRTVSMTSLRDEFRDAEALQDQGYTRLRVTENGLRAESYLDSRPPADIRATENGGVEITANGERREARSTFTPAEGGEGFRESSEVREYSTIGGARRLREETRLERDENGEVTSRDYTYHEYDGGRREETYRQTETGHTETSRRVGADGEVEYRREQSVATEDGTTTTRTVTEDSRETETEVSYRYEDGTRRNESETVRSDGTRRTSVRTTDTEGNATSRTFDERRDRDGNIVTTERVTRDGTLQESRRTEVIEPDTDVPGLGWIGSHNPQDLVERLGDEDTITGERTVISRRQEDGSYADQEIITMRSGDGSRELIQSQGPHGGNAWELRERNADGSWDSQIFLQGTEDTIITRSRNEGGFRVEERTANTPSLHEQNENVPEESRSTVRTAEAATTQQIEGLMDNSPLSTIRETDSFRQFMEQSGDGPFQVVHSDSEETGANGTVNSSNFMMEAPDGRRLAATYNHETQTYTVKTFDEEGTTSGLSAITREGNQFERLEVSADGQVTTSVASASGEVRNWVRVAEDVITSPQQVARGARAARTIVRLDEALMGTNSAGISSLGSRILDGKWASRIGVGAGGAAAVLSGMSLTADLAGGDYAGAARTAGTMGIDIATVSKSLNSDVFGAPATAASRAGRWAAQGSRFLGAAGAVTSVVFAGVDAYNGEYVRAGLGAASAGGAALALFGTSSLAGPLGWGIAGVASIGLMAWDYNQGTRVADYQL